jgi:formylglycine-generating enzyme required for sulfatase activity
MSRWTALCLGLGLLPAARADGPPTRPVLTNSVGMKLALIPAGEFLMGAADGEQEARDDERPRHHVRITRPFYLGVFEVTQEEYERVMGSNPSFFSPAGPGKDRVAGRKTGRFPVEQVSWHEAVEFCRRLSALPEEKKAGRVYRLPTEAEWEYAGRAGTTSATHHGPSLSARQANFNGRDPYGAAEAGPFLLRPAEVGSYAPNAWGLYDMHGNVWEWCADWYGADYYRHAPTADPAGPASGSARVIRSGGWRTEGASCRSAFRNADVPAGRYAWPPAGRGGTGFARPAHWFCASGALVLRPRALVWYSITP